MIPDDSNITGLGKFGLCLYGLDLLFSDIHEKLSAIKIYLTKGRKQNTSKTIATTIKVAAIALTSVTIYLERNQLCQIGNELINGVVEITTGAQVTRTRYFARGPGLWNDALSETRSDFIGQLMPDYAQREDWYQLTPFIAEPINTLSNVGFFHVGVKHNSPFVLFAGLASVASHTCPKQWLLTLDKCGAGFAGLAVGKRVLINYKAIDAATVAASVGVGCVFWLDMHLAATVAAWWPHPLWHIIAALAIDMVFTKVHSLYSCK